LPPDPHETLYRKLAEITDRVSFALTEADPDELMLLAEKQDIILRELRQAGICKDSRLLVRVLALSRQVSDVMTEIQLCRHEVSTRIRQISDGKKLIHAYVG